MSRDSLSGQGTFLSSCSATVRCAYNVPYTVLKGIQLVTSTFFFLQYATRSSALQLILMPPTNTTLRAIFLPPRRSAGFLWRLAASCTIDQSYLVLTGFSVVRLALLVRGVERVRLAYVSHLGLRGKNGSSRTHPSPRNHKL